MRQKGFSPITIVVGILLIFTVAFGAYFLGTKNNKPSTQTEQTTTKTNPTPVASTTPLTIVDETANWKTYVNKTHKYTVKYPRDWESGEAAHGMSAVEPIFIAPLSKETVSDLEVQIIIRIDPLTSGCKGDEVINIDKVKGYKQKKIVNGETVELKGANGEVIPSKKFAYSTIDACVIRGNEIYVFNFVDKDYSREKIIDQIISTFKFTQ